MKTLCAYVLLATSIMTGCATPVSDTRQIRDEKATDSPTQPKNESGNPDIERVSELNFIKNEKNDGISIGGYVKMNSGPQKGYSRIILTETWLPDGRNLGFDRLAGARMRGFVFKCELPYAYLQDTLITDTKAEKLHRISWKDTGIKKVSRDSDQALGLAMNHICVDK